jgi:hypothetical protein
MADPTQALTFLPWVRERVAELATSQQGGRTGGQADVTLTSRGPDGASAGAQTRPLPFLLAGPADVLGLHAGAIARRFPAPGTVDHESDRCPYVELADPSLPWRYTPAMQPAAGSAALHPWLVLVVGQDGSELTVADGIANLATSIQGGPHALGAPNTPHRFAHVQVDASGHRTARVLCGHLLQSGTDYVAALVPAYDESGALSWTGAAPASVPAYDSWRFRTAVPAGSFEDLASRLKPGDPPATLGHAPMHYPRLPGAAEQEVLGALVAVPPGGTVTEAPLPPDIAADLAALKLPARDSEGRPIVALPRYGDAWSPAAPEGSTWGRSLNDDPRHRGVAGLGLEVGIRNQDDLVADVVAHLGALQEARQRVRHLVMGVTTSQSLWRRRVPAEATDRLWLLGPSMSRLATGQGSIADLATRDDRTLARGTFSAAARRVLRAGPARTALGVSAARRVTPRAADLLAAANQQPPAPPSRADGVPLDPAGEVQFDQARRKVLIAGHVATKSLVAAANGLVSRTDPRVRGAATQLATAMSKAAQQGRAVPWGEALPLLAAADAGVVGRGKDPTGSTKVLGTSLGGLRDGVGTRGDDADLAELVAQLGRSQADDPVLSAVDLPALASAVSDAFDPTAAVPPVVRRVMGTVTGLDPQQLLAPPEICVGLDRAAWRDVEQAFDEWLLPGVDQLATNSVISLGTNPLFIEPFLAGLNTQLLTELRWRNIPVATGCTPIRRFWDRFDATAGQRLDDIIGIAGWTDDSALGDGTHLAPGASAGELVIAVRGDLFLRYPTTLVYLQSAVHGSSADFDHDPDPDAPRVLPGFQGRMAGDVAFFGFPGVAAADVVSHWVVFEEPPAGYRFANDSTTAASTGQTWAAETFAQPVRVLIQGDILFTGAS